MITGLPYLRKEDTEQTDIRFCIHDLLLRCLRSFQGSSQFLASEQLRRAGPLLWQQNEKIPSLNLPLMFLVPFQLKNMHLMVRKKQNE